MAQIASSPEIAEIVAIRGRMKASGEKSAFGADVMALIDEIRGDIPSSEDGDGWMKIGAARGTGHGPGAGAGAGHGSGHGQGARSFPSKDAFRGINRDGNGGSGDRDRDRDHYKSGHRDNGHSGGSGYHGRGGGGSSGDHYKSGGGYGGHSAPRPKFMCSKPLEATSNQPVQPPIQKRHHHSGSGGGGTTGGAPHRYVSKFKAKEQTVESTIVNTIILNRLNKLSHSNYPEVRDFLMEILASGETDFLADFMHLIFTKAAAEEIFCPLYARLLKELSGSYPFLVTEMLAIYGKFLDIFDEITEESCKDTEEFIQKNKEKKYRKGYSQFITELYKQGILDADQFMRTIDKIAANIVGSAAKDDHVQLVEEYAACFLCICKGIGGGAAASGPAGALIAEKLGALLVTANVKSAAYPSLTNKIRFALLDARDACRAGAA